MKSLLSLLIILISPSMVFAKNDSLMSFVVIPPGEFNMGSSTNFTNPIPVHQVKIQSFKMMDSEVTWAMYQPCIDDGVCDDNDSDGGDEGWGKKNKPVINVSYDNIKNQFIPWINKKTNQTFRLPSEAEWEYAARAGSHAKFSWGDKINCSQARFYGGTDSKCDYKNNDEFKGASDVKSYSANAFGLYDMHGNVWEWVEDCWSASYKNTPIDGSAYKPEKCSKLRSVRGGSWNDPEKYLYSASRNRNIKDNKLGIIGFRLAQDF